MQVIFDYVQLAMNCLYVENGTPIEVILDAHVVAHSFSFQLPCLFLIAYRFQGESKVINITWKGQNIVGDSSSHLNTWEWLSARVESFRREEILTKWR